MDLKKNLISMSEIILGLLNTPAKVSIYNLLPFTGTAVPVYFCSVMSILVVVHFLTILLMDTKVR